MSSEMFTEQVVNLEYQMHGLEGNAESDARNSLGTLLYSMAQWVRHLTVGRTRLLCPSTNKLCTVARQEFFYDKLYALHIVTHSSRVQLTYRPHDKHK